MESVHTENTHVVLESEPMVGYIVSVDPVLKSVGKQVFNYSTSWSSAMTSSGSHKTDSIDLV